MKAKRGPRSSPSPGANEATGRSPTLPPWKAFVVQFSGDTSSTGGVFAGRVEHLNTGHRARFSSAQELLGVLARLLREYGER